MLRTSTNLFAPLNLCAQCERIVVTWQPLAVKALNTCVPCLLNCHAPLRRSNLAAAADSDARLEGKLASSAAGFAALTVDAAASQMPRLQVPVLHCMRQVLVLSA